MLEFRDTCFAEDALEVRVEISVSAAASLNFRDEKLRKCAERGPPFSSSSRVRFLRDMSPLKAYFLHPPAAFASGAGRHRQARGGLGFFLFFLLFFHFGPILKEKSSRKEY